MTGTAAGRSYRAPKSIISHPGVQECGFGPDEGIEGYRHAVFLRKGWTFTRGRMAGCRTGNFNNVRDFQFACPTLAAAQPKGAA